MLQRHAGEGETIAEAIRDCLDYGKDPEKTESGKYISAYECDPATVADEFLLAKASYAAMTGREQKKENNVLCYQIRQSFYPGEITPKEANRIGYELAMRWTKGRHAFIVTTHTDKQHIHCHIYYNSTTLDCTRKFRNFWGSSFALRRLSDRLCLENGLSIVENPKPRSKGKYRNYGEWQKERKGPLSYQDRLRLAIDTALAERPADLDEFLNLMKRAGYEVKTVRGGGISFRLTGQGQERFTRLRASTLGDGYGPEDVQAVIDGKAPTRTAPVRRAPTPRRVNLLIDIQERMRQGKGPAYERWAKVYNLKQMAAALQYLLPTIIFLVAVFLAFATGTSWGTFSILIPIVCHAFPEGEMLVISIAACLSGAVCGDHCSPISDTTIMASAGAHCSHVNHVSTQLPYAITAASCAAVCYVITGIAQAFLGANGSLLTSLVLLVVAIVLELAVLSVIRARTRAKTSGDAA